MLRVVCWHYSDVVRMLAGSFRFALSRTVVTPDFAEIPLFGERLMLSFNTARRCVPSALLVTVTLAAAAAMSACSKTEEAKTVGQKVDTAIEKSEKLAAQAKAKTERAMTDASVAVKDATQKAEVSVQGKGNKMENKLDDMGITAAVKTALAKDSDISESKINVDTKNGAVILKGTAATSMAKAKATDIATANTGVVSVDNQLLVTTK